MGELNKDLETEALTILDEAKAIAVTTQQQYARAAEFVKSVKGLQKKVKDHHADIIRKTNEAHKAAKETEQKLLKPLDEAERIVKSLCNKFMAEQESLRRIEEDRLRAEARAKAEAEAAKKQKEAEFLADVMGETAPEPEAVIVPEIKVESTPKIDGTYFVETWKYEITDPLAIPEEYKVIDEKKIGEVVRALKGLTVIPGVRVFAEKKMRQRS